MRRYIGWLIVCALALAPNVAAQQNATVQGIVADESQGMLPGATVTANEISTGVQSVAVTMGDGRYQFDNLPPGQYNLQVWHERLGTTRASVTISDQQAGRVTVEMKSP